MIRVPLDFMFNHKYTSEEILYVLLFHMVASHCTILQSLLTTFIKFLIVPTWKIFPITSRIFIKTLSLLWKKEVTEN